MEKTTGKVRFGIIGLGNMGHSHAENIYRGDIPDGVLTAACDIKNERLVWAKEKIKGVRLFNNVTDMFKSGEIDAVIIAVPHYYHPQLAIEAFDYKLNVMCEKPAGVYTKQVREMNEKAAKTNSVFAMMFNQRTNCVYRKMKEMMETGQLGNLRRSVWIITDWYRSQFYYDSGDWRATWSGEGGGVLLNQCPHNLDLWQWICGMPNKVRAFCNEGKWHNIEVEDDVTAYITYPNGATGVFITTTGDTPGTNRFEITGDLGKLVCEGRNKLLFYKNEMPEQEYSKTTREAFGRPRFEEIEVGTDGLNPQHNGVLTAFVNKILGRGELIAAGEEGINGLTLSNAMHLSSWLDRTVSLPLDEDLFYLELQKKIKNSTFMKKSFSYIETNMSKTY